MFEFCKGFAKWFAAICKPFTNSAIVFYAAREAFFVFFPGFLELWPTIISAIFACCHFLVSVSTKSVAILKTEKLSRVGEPLRLFPEHRTFLNSSKIILFLVGIVKGVCGWFAVSWVLGGATLAKCIAILPALSSFYSFAKFNTTQAEEGLNFLLNRIRDRSWTYAAIAKTFFTSILGTIANAGFTFFFLSEAMPDDISNAESDVLRLSLAVLGGVLVLLSNWLSDTMKVYQSFEDLPALDEIPLLGEPKFGSRITDMVLVLEIISTFLGYTRGCVSFANQVFGATETGAVAFMSALPFVLSACVNYGVFVLKPARKTINEGCSRLSCSKAGLFSMAGSAQPPGGSSPESDQMALMP